MCSEIDRPGASGAEATDGLAADGSSLRSPGSGGWDAPWCVSFCVS